jgi:hypothetical protein
VYESAGARVVAAPYVQVAATADAPKVCGGALSLCVTAGAGLPQSAPFPIG